MFGRDKKPETTEKVKIKIPRIGFGKLAAEKTKKFNFDEIIKKSLQKTHEDFKMIGADGKAVAAMDSSPLQQAKSLFGGRAGNIPNSLIDWYASQGFIGYQLCAILAQQYLVDRACTMPARDAVRNGYDISVNDGTEIPAEVLDHLRTLDKDFRLHENLIEYVRFARIFGIRIAIFKVDGIDYEKPFNIDGVKMGSYKGICQVDPYWITPELDIAAGSDPASINFYEPTWWRVGNQRYHRSHLCIMRPTEVSDILKPSYMYGGISVPQKIYERVYCAERTASEAPQLAMTKRILTYKMDMGNAIANQADVETKLQAWTELMNNYAVKVIGGDEEVTQHDISLSDLDDVIMTQYQIVAGAAGVPLTKLIGTAPKGLGATGEFDESNYHEELESVQSNDLTPMIQRHHDLLVRSELPKEFPEFKNKPFDTTVAWKPLDSMTAKELAEVNQMKADTGLKLQQAGSIDGEDERQRLINDPDSGYNGMEERVPENPLNEGEGVENQNEAVGSTNVPVRPSTPVQGAEPDDEKAANQ